MFQQDIQGTWISFSKEKLSIVKYTQENTGLVNEYKYNLKYCCFFFFLFKVRRISTNEEMTEALMPDWINRTDIFQDSENYQQENCGMNKLHRNEMISQCIDLAGQTGKAVTAFFITIFFFPFCCWDAVLFHLPKLIW